MIKKAAGIFFILLANIVLLVHAVVPHHHHQEQVCIALSHCQNESHAPSGNTADHDHEQNGSSETECCILKQAAVVPVNSLRQEFKCVGCDADHSHFVHFQTILFSTEFNPFVPEIISIAQIPLKTSSHSSFVHSSLGLRAPPTV
jgi:hypothetical protein